MEQPSGDCRCDQAAGCAVRRSAAPYHNLRGTGRSLGGTWRIAGHTERDEFRRGEAGRDFLARESGQRSQLHVRRRVTRRVAEQDNAVTANVTAAAMPMTAVRGVTACLTGSGVRLAAGSITASTGGKKADQ